MSDTANVWTDERLEKLKILWEEGLSISQIGEALGVSRNSIAGALGGTQITIAQTQIGINHADKTKLRKMMALGDNLRADNNIGLTGADAFNGIAHGGHPAHI